MFKNHPKGLLAAALSNMGERFGYYIMNAVLVLFLCSKFGLSDEVSAIIYSVFYCGIYVLSLVGGIIADASETVLAGAGMLKNTIGVFGMLAILAACAYPFLQLGVQYLLYKLTAYLASVVGAPGLCKLIDGLGGAFGLILGMTGGCALLLLISVLASVGAVMP